MKRFFRGILVWAVCLVIIVGSTSTAFPQQKNPLGQYATIKDYEKATGKKITKFNEAPMLQELVKQGKLPPVEKRLPEEPAVVEPIEEIGEYGGTFRRALLGISDSMGYRYLIYDPIVRWSREGLKVIPNLAKSWKILDDGRTYIFYLRKGVKWSDGEPFTADDIIFWYEDILLNKEITPSFPSWLITGNSQVKIEKIDNYTVKFSFKDPYPLFLKFLAFQGTVFAPAHYLKQFHPKYTPLNTIEAEAKKEGFQNWYQLFAQKNNLFLNPDLPVLSAWKVVKSFPNDPMVAERNPYYWKVDTIGNQLPYIDRITCALCANSEIVLMKALNGEVDMQFRHLGPADFTLLMENRDKGGYRVINALQVGIASGIYFNMNCKDPVLRSLFENRKFRIALSLAIDRNSINQLCYNGLLKPL